MKEFKAKTNENLNKSQTNQNLKMFEESET